VYIGPFQLPLPPTQPSLQGANVVKLFILISGNDIEQNFKHLDVLHIWTLFKNLKHNPSQTEAIETS